MADSNTEDVTEVATLQNYDCLFALYSQRGRKKPLESIFDWVLYLPYFANVECFFVLSAKAFLAWEILTYDFLYLTIRALLFRRILFQVHQISQVMTAFAAAKLTKRYRGNVQHSAFRTDVNSIVDNQFRKISLAFRNFIKWRRISNIRHLRYSQNSFPLQNRVNAD